MMMHRVLEIPEGHDPGWSLKTTVRDGRVVHLELSSRFGVLSYGWMGGYDGWSFYEGDPNGGKRGGGTIAMPFHRDAQGRFYFAVIEEIRSNMGGPSYCAIGGFADAGEDEVETGVRETLEETGFNPRNATLMKGVPINANRGFFQADHAGNEGVHALSVGIPAGLLSPHNSVPNALAFKSAAIGGAVVNKGDRGGVVFLPWRSAIEQTPCGLALAGMARLIASEF